MAVLATPTYLQFFDDNGDPLADGTIVTYAAGTTTRKATYTDASGSQQAPNPIELGPDGIPESGNGSIWIQGSYKFIVYDANGIEIRTTDNVTSFSGTIAGSSPYRQTFSGTGAQTSYTLSQDFGTDENNIQVFISSATGGYSQTFNGTGAQTVFTLNQNKGTDSSALLVFVYNAALGDKLGYEIQDPSTYTINGTTLTFTVAPATGTGNIYVRQPNTQSTGIFGFVSPSAYTLNGTNLTFASAPPLGTNNIEVIAPSLAAAQAALYAANADASATAAGNSAASAAGYAQAKLRWMYSNTVTMADPGAGNIRFNNASIPSVTQIAISDLSGDSGNPDLSSWVNTWDDGSGSNRGTLYIFKDNANFALFAVSAANVDNTTWNRIAVTYLSRTGTFTNGDALFIGFAANGATTVTGGITALTGDISASGTGSVAATINPGAVDLTTDVSNILPIANGGSGRATATTAYGIIAAGTTAAGVQQTISPGPAGQVLTSNGAAALPTFQASAGLGTATVVALTGSSVTLTVDFATYSAYEFVFMDATAQSTFSFAVSSNAGSSYGSTGYNGFQVSGTTLAANAGAALVQSAIISNTFQGRMLLTQPATSGGATYNFQMGGGGNITNITNGVSSATAAINRVQFNVTSSQSFSSGTITYYPVARR